MLLTIRSPIADLRGFANQDRLSRSVVLPGSWATGTFVRGLGPVTARHTSPVEPWAYEGAYADLSRAVAFSGDSVAAFDREFPAHHIQRARKRAWMALHDSTALLDVDIALQLAASAEGRKHTYSRGLFSVQLLTQAVAMAASLEVRVETDEHSKMFRLLEVGKPLARRYDVQTSSTRTASSSTRAGRALAVLEAPGLAPDDLSEASVTGVDRAGVQLTSFTANVRGGGQLRTHLLWAPTPSAIQRRRIREIRIHLLRLHSTREFLRCLATSSNWADPLAGKRSKDGFQALQRTLLSCVRLAEGESRAGHHQPASVLEAAFPGERLFDDDLMVLLNRTLDAMRPKVRTEIDAYRQREQERLDVVAAGGREKGTTVNTFNIKAKTIGLVGDQAQIERLEVKPRGDVITINGAEISRSRLQDEIDELRLAAAGREPEAEHRLAAASASLVKGSDSGVARHLRHAGRWAFNTATELGLNVASSAISHSMGL